MNFDLLDELYHPLIASFSVEGDYDSTRQGYRLGNGFIRAILRKGNVHTADGIIAIYWRDQVANVRDHDATRERPIDRFEKERDLLRPLPVAPFLTDEMVSVVAIRTRE
jgi:hypothetical protein